MSEHFTGGCQCGAVNYCVRGKSVNLFVCHCTQCQKQSSSAFGMALWVEDFDVESVSGALDRWTRLTPEGYEMTGEFCAQCGSRLFHRFSGAPHILSIKPGTLKNTRELRPVAHIWTDERQRWYEIPQDTLSYPASPPSFEAMFKAWHNAQK